MTGWTERGFLGCRGEEKKHLFSNNYRNGVKSIVRSTDVKYPCMAGYVCSFSKPSLAMGNSLSWPIYSWDSYTSSRCLAHSLAYQQSRYCFSSHFTGSRSDQKSPFLAAFPSFRVCLAMQNQVTAADKARHIPIWLLHLSSCVSIRSGDACARLHVQPGKSWAISAVDSGTSMFLGAAKKRGKGALWVSSRSAHFPSPSPLFS